MAVCECGHSEERHDPEDGVCLGADCECEEFIEMYNEEGGEEYEDAHDDDFYAEGVFEDDELIPEEDEEMGIIYFTPLRGTNESFE